MSTSGWSSEARALWPYVTINHFNKTSERRPLNRNVLCIETGANAIPCDKHTKRSGCGCYVVFTFDVIVENLTGICGYWRKGRTGGWNREVIVTLCIVWCMKFEKFELKGTL